MSKASVSFGAKTHPTEESYEYGTEEVQVHLTYDFGDDAEDYQGPEVGRDELGEIAEQLLNEAKIKVYGELGIEFSINEAGAVVRQGRAQVVAQAFGGASTPGVQIQAGEDRANIPAPAGAPAAASSEPGTWEHLVASFGEYYDNRLDKRSPNGPDFKHKKSGKGLWLKGKYGDAPDWVFDRLNGA